MSYRSADRPVPTSPRPEQRHGTVLEAVRRATASRHRRLEMLAVSARLLQADYELAEYRAWLLRLYGFYEPLALRARSSAVDWRARALQRARALACDLTDLGMSAAALRAAPRCTVLPPLDTRDGALGCAYVIEGAALGGRVISRNLTRVFGAAPGVPMRFYTGAGEQTLRRWHAFCAQLNARAQDVDAVCAAADAAFAALESWLDADADR